MRPAFSDECMPSQHHSARLFSAGDSLFLTVPLTSTGEPGQLEASLRHLDQALNAGRHHLQQREALASSSSPDRDSTYMGYVSLAVNSILGVSNRMFRKGFFSSLTSFVQMRLMGECRGSIDAVKRAEGELTEDEDAPGLTNLNSTDAQGSGQGFTRSSHSDLLHQR